MAIQYITVRGYIRDGRLEIELPDNAAEGEIEVEVPIAETPLTDSEIEALMRPSPKSGTEIAEHPAIGSWADMGIEDSVEWVAEQRRKRREARRW